MHKSVKITLGAALVVATTIAAGILAPLTASASAAASTTPSTPLSATTVVMDHVQKPSLNGVVQTESVKAVAPVGPAAGRPSGTVTKFTLNPAARYVQGSVSRPRVEVYGRYPAKTNIPATSWPDPVGSTRWYTFSLLLPSDFQTTTTTPWVVLTQWKGLKGGTPPLDIEVHKNFLKMGGANVGGLANQGSIGDLPIGKWTKLSIGVKWSTSASDGWLQVIRDGKTVIAKRSMATMGTVGGVVDPVYLKQGIYQGGDWTKTHVSYTSKVVVSSTAP